jgi:hypothetical protein
LIIISLCFPYILCPGSLKLIKNVPQKIAVQSFHKKCLYYLRRLPPAPSSKQSLITEKKTYISRRNLKFIMLSFLKEEIFYAFRIMQSKMSVLSFLLPTWGRLEMKSTKPNKSHRNRVSVLDHQKKRKLAGFNMSSKFHHFTIMRSKRIPTALVVARNSNASRFSGFYASCPPVHLIRTKKNQQPRTVLPRTPIIHATNFQATVVWNHSSVVSVWNRRGLVLEMRIRRSRCTRCRDISSWNSQQLIRTNPRPKQTSDASNSPRPVPNGDHPHH